MTTSLMNFMFELRNDPKILSRYCPEIVDSLDVEPVNLSKKLRGTPHELKGVVVAYGFGSPLKHVISVTFMRSGQKVIDDADQEDIMRLQALYGIKPFIIGLSGDGLNG
jgi:hypothetical protein